MPRALLFENAVAPSSRTARQLRSLAAAGWEVTLALRAGTAPEPLPGVEVVRIDHPLDHPLTVTARSDLARLDDESALVRERYLAMAEALKEARDDLDRNHPLREALLQVRTELDRARDTVVADLHAERSAVEAARRHPTPLARPHGFGDLLRLEGFWGSAARILAGLPWDVAQAVDLDTLPAAVWAARATDRPVLFDAHELFPDLDYLPEVYREAWRRLGEDFVPLADLVVTVSEPMAAVLATEFGAARVEMVPNYPPVGSSPSGLRRHLGLPPEAPLAVHIGAVVDNRRPERAVAAVRGLRDLHVAFLGTARPETRAAVERLAETRGVGDRLHFVEPVPMEELVPFVAEADLSLILYSGEASRHLDLTLPNKLFDALAAGLPVVAAEGTAVADYVLTRGVGAVFDPADPDGMGAVVHKVLEDPSFRRQAGALAPEVTWERVEGRYLDLLGRLLPEGS